MLTAPPKLNTVLRTDIKFDCHFIHDIVVLPELRGKGVADIVIKEILSEYPVISLVAADDEVIKTKTFWARYGFEVMECSNCDYGIFMVRDVTKNI